ncbi:hypothetical protein SAMN05444392_1151 [Seinonella peptonophila]|uniref:Uncharacterized protein n=1 Tax=Seinonella peptonophila TaxID=112248 RepID=A0A1M5AMP4_9BACL|nr:hypothetical protein [Seinonella peptonophila]SHF31503.1 hypothetical protein SAMN05444392_1151 [Seinonella peptonophila]
MIYIDPQHVIAYSDGEVRQQFSICSACSIVGGKLILSSESTQLNFFEKDELKQLEMHPAQRIRIRDFFLNSAKTYIR